MKSIDIALCFALALGLAAPGCGSPKPGVASGSTGGNSSGSVTKVEGRGQTVTKIDLLLAIDNSRSMADKQQILALAVPDLLSSFVNPRCLDAKGNAVAGQPAGPLDPCPNGSQRDFPPVLDIHVGVVTSSLGGFGSDSCPDSDALSCKGGMNKSQNDHGELISRTDPCQAGNVPTYQGRGFLAWDPAQRLTPPGEKELGNLSSTPGIVPDLDHLLIGAGQVGCGFSSQNEAWYRFLVEPTPPQSVGIVNGLATPMGTDTVLLQQRADLLRADSLLTIVVLTDKNDASIEESGQYWYVAQRQIPGTNQTFHLPRSRHECVQNPADTCCRSCAQSQLGCVVDPPCGVTPELSDSEDPFELRRWNSKRRFGIEFYYTPDRYVNALTSATVADRDGHMVANPIFSALGPQSGTAVRTPSQVFLAEIVGVPWQDIARQDANGKPDLLAGLDDSGNPVGGFKTWHEMAKANPSGQTPWDVVLGNADFVTTYGLPADPLMIESATPRVGTNPITGDPAALVSSPSGTNPINGHEYTAHDADLEYACIFDLPVPRDCADPSQPACDCLAPDNDNPLCEPNPGDGGNRTLQVRAKAYPGLKELAILKALGPQGIVGSICPQQLTDQTKSNFGYRPAIHTIVDSVKAALGGGCLERELAAGPTGQVPCVVLEARDTGGAKCTCDAPARVAVPASEAAVEAAASQDPTAATAGWNCYCEIAQASGAALTSCQSDAVTPTGEGWCYIDASATSGVGNPALVKNCPASAARTLRFDGQAAPLPGATLFLSCSEG